MKSFVIALIALVAVSASSSAALAGGDNGGSKKNTTIRVTNNTNVTAAAILDNSNPPLDDLDSFTSAGGKLIAPGATVSFKTSAGSHTLRAALIIDDSSDPVEIGDVATATYNVGKGKTRNVSITSTDDETAVLN